MPSVSVDEDIKAARDTGESISFDNWAPQTESVDGNDSDSNDGELTGLGDAPAA
jgi:hypothetical protein